MIINQASLSAIFQGFQTIFKQAFAGVTPQWSRIATEVPSTKKEEIYAWLGTFPKMREWLGDRQVKNLALSSYAIKNKPFESTVGVERDDIEDDSYGVYSPLIAELGRSAAAHPDELVFPLLAAGFASLCYDGQYFFDSDHLVGGSNVSNTGGGSGTGWYLLDISRAIKPIIYQNRKTPEFITKDNPNDDNVFFKKQFIYGVDCRDNVGYGLWQMAYGSKQTLDATYYAAARAAMMAFKDDDGKPLGINPGLLVVPPSLEGAGRALLLAETTSAGATNPWKGTAELLVSPWLS